VNTVRSKHGSTRDGPTIDDEDPVFVTHFNVLLNKNGLVIPPLDQRLVKIVGEALPGGCPGPCCKWAGAAD